MVEMPRYEAPLALLQPPEALLVSVTRVADTDSLVAITCHVIFVTTAPGTNDAI